MPDSFIGLIHMIETLEKRWDVLDNHQQPTLGVSRQIEALNKRLDLIPAETRVSELICLSPVGFGKLTPSETNFKFMKSLTLGFDKDFFEWIDNLIDTHGFGQNMPIQEWLRLVFKKNFGEET